MNIIPMQTVTRGAGVGQKDEEEDMRMKYKYLTQILHHRHAVAFMSLRPRWESCLA